MPILDHLEELRWRIIKALGAVIVFAIPSGIYWRKIFDLALVYPMSIANPRPRLIFTTPGEAVVISMKIAIVGGIIGALPVLFYQLWKFVAPGLYKHEKKIILPTVLASTFCFLLGVSFAYLVLPYFVKFLAEYGAGVLDPFFKASDYINFIMTMVLSFGAIFELPVVAFALAKLGIITPQFLIKNIRYAIVLIFVVAAILTPPDIISQCVMAAPLIILYGMSILTAHWGQRKKT